MQMNLMKLTPPPPNANHSLLRLFLLTHLLNHQKVRSSKRRKKKVRAVTLSREHLENKSLRDGARDQRTHMVTQEVKYFQVDPDTKRGESLGGFGDSGD